MQQSHCDFLGNGLSGGKKAIHGVPKIGGNRKWISLDAFEEAWQKQETDRLTTHIRQQYRHPQYVVQ